MSEQDTYGPEGLYDHPDVVIGDMVDAEEIAERKLPDAIEDIEALATLLRLANESLHSGEKIDRELIESLRELFEKYSKEGKYICNALQRVSELYPAAMLAAEILDEQDSPSC